MNRAATKEVAVIGAGITGVLAAYYLAKDGYQVTVFEGERYPAMRTSYSNGGQVSVSNSEVWNTWSNVGKGLKWMFKKDAPLLVGSPWSAPKLKWLLKFFWHTAAGDYARNTTETIRLGLESRKLYTEIIDQEGLQFDQSYCGILHLYRDEKYLAAAVQAGGIYTSNGCQWDILTPQQTTSLDPSLQTLNGVIGGAWTPGDWTGDIHKFCTGLSARLAEEYGVKFVFGKTITPENAPELLQNFRSIVISAGVGSVDLAKIFGDSLPIYPVKGYSITINVKEGDMQYIPRVSLLDDQAKIVTSTLGNRWRVAGTAELAGENYDIRRDRITPLLDWVHKNFPHVDTSDYQSWACLRPMTPNMLPIVGGSRTGGVYYHTGHGHLGWTLSPATARQLVELINAQEK